MPGGLNLREDVLNSGVCALCGACLDWCPYILNLEDRLILRFDCPVQDGRCYAVCPRTFTDWSEINRKFFLGTDNGEQGIGSFIRVYKTKAKKAQKYQQDGGTVSAIVKDVLNRRKTAALVTDSRHYLEPIPILADVEQTAAKAAGSKFLASPGLRKIIEAQERGLDSLLVVSRPCQIQALRKMQHNNYWPDSMELVSIGLFCMWSLEWSFKDYLEQEYKGIVKISIPQQGLEIKTEEQTVRMPAEQIRPYIRSGCKYCVDMTSELADISVGAFEPEEGWNTVIVRTAKGQELLEQSKNLLDMEEYPEPELQRLQNASLNKKKRALLAIEDAITAGVLRQGFIDLEDPLYKGLLSAQREEVKR